MYFISLLHIMAMAMILGVIYLILKPKITIEGVSKLRITTEHKVSIVILCVLLFPTLVIFFYPLFLPITLLHGLLFIVLRSTRIARLWTPSLTQWFLCCTIFIFAYLSLAFPIPDFIWNPFEDPYYIRGQDPNPDLYFYSGLLALLYAPYISLAFITIVCLFKKLFKKLSGQKGSA